MRPLSLACTWWNLISWSSVALYTLTGTLTSPKEIEPFQIERIVPVCPYCWAGTPLTTMRRRPAGYIPGFDPTDPFDLNRPTGLAIEMFTDKVEGIARDLDDAAGAVGFHAACHIDRLTPQVVDEFAAADDARDHRAGVDADAEGEPSATEGPLADLFLHIQCEVDQRFSVIHPLAWHACSDHVTVADRLDLLQLVLVDKIVEALEYFVEQIDQGERQHGRRHRGESDDVGEQDAGLVVVGGDRSGFGLEGLGDLRRQDVEEQHLRALLEEITTPNEVMQQPVCDRDHRSRFNPKNHVTNGSGRCAGLRCGCSSAVMASSATKPTIQRNVRLGSSSNSEPNGQSAAQTMTTLDC